MLGSPGLVERLITDILRVVTGVKFLDQVDIRDIVAVDTFELDVEREVLPA